MKRPGILLPLAAILIGISLLASGCATPIHPDSASARELVAKAYASGASRLATQKYQAAYSALHKAERHIRLGEDDLAYESLRISRQFALEALQLTEQEKQKRLEQMRQKKIVHPEVKPVVIKPKPVKVIQPKPVVPPPPQPPKPVVQVKVGEGETLSNISARQEVYGDPLLWPLVYKANRDQIKDPMQIFPGQTLIIPRDKTDDEKEAAREEARRSELFR